MGRGRPVSGRASTMTAERAKRAKIVINYSLRSSRPLRFLSSGQFAVARFGDPDPGECGEEERRASGGEGDSEAARLCEPADRERRGRAGNPSEVVAEARRGCA